MSCREREVVLVRGPPWGFRVTGGSDTVHALKVERGGGEGGGLSSSYYWQISRVNPGSLAAERMREGDVISCINGRDTSNLTNQVSPPSQPPSLLLLLLPGGPDHPQLRHRQTHPEAAQ